MKEIKTSGFNPRTHLLSALQTIPPHNWIFFLLTFYPESDLPSKDLTLQGFKPLNEYQLQAVEQALTKAFTLIQGPPGNVSL